MLKGNLSTRPFYNERLATLGVVLIVLVALALTIFNATELVRLSSERSATQARIDRDQAEITRIRTQAGSAQQTVDRAVLARLAQSTREANDIIDQRTFSWTAFFKLIEKTLPNDVRLVMVSPRVESGTFKVAIDVVARSLPEVASFIEALRGTGSFRDVAPIAQQSNPDGTMSATIEAAYVSAPTAKVPEPPAAARGKKS